MLIGVNQCAGVTDFRPGLGNIVFQGNQREACGQVEIKNDNNPESNEVFMVTFFATNLVIPQPPDRPAPIAEVTIIDDDGKSDYVYIRHLLHDEL